MRELFTRYIWSTVVTFLAGVAIVVVPELNEELTWEAVQDGALVGILFSGVRLGFKMVLETFLLWWRNSRGV